MRKIVCLSDTHNCNEKIVVPDGDVLIHSGDATINGTGEEIRRFNQWFSALPHKHKIFVAGNHDWLFETGRRQAENLLDPGIIYLQDSAAEIDGIKIYGSPWQPRFYDWAFNLNRGAEMAEKWKMIPEGLDILITHGPPHGILDRTPNGDLAGCEELREKVVQVCPKVHIFGHIHHGYGMKETFGIKFINASNCDENYFPRNPPLVFEL
jgi:Icc-related predicted phosphoesterase